MDRPASFKIDRGEGEPRVALSGDWTARGMGRASTRLSVQLKGADTIALDAADLGKFDSVAAFAILEAAREIRPPVDRPDVAELLQFVISTRQEPEPSAHAAMNPTYAMLVRAGIA
jgi:phospholipid/cholesterol/gamma-HCH transport system permease protein